MKKLLTILLCLALLVSTAACSADTPQATVKSILKKKVKLPFIALAITAKKPPLD